MNLTNFVCFWSRMTKIWKMIALYNLYFSMNLLWWLSKRFKRTNISETWWIYLKSRNRMTYFEPFSSQLSLANVTSFIIEIVMNEKASGIKPIFWIKGFLLELILKFEATRKLHSCNSFGFFRSFSPIMVTLTWGNVRFHLITATFLKGCLKIKQILLIHIDIWLEQDQWWRTHF